MLLNDHNILLHQIIVDNSSFSFKETIPYYEANKDSQVYLTRIGSNLLWSSIDLSLNIIVNNKFKDTNIYYADDRIGLGRFPLFNYKVDIAVPKDTLMTAFHIGDGSYGFSMGNGTTKGFIPEIIGMSSNKNDAGLYFVGTSRHLDNDSNNKIPLIVFDGRTIYGKLEYRPILGITSYDYYNYVVLIDNKGNIFANDLIINNISLIKKIQELENEIKELKKV